LSAIYDDAATRTQGNRLDFARFFFASLVVLSHSFPIATGTEAFEPLALFSNNQLTLGAVAVDCFFIISGYLIMKSWIVDPRWAGFLAKRVRRIYPGFIVAAVLGIFGLWAATTAGGYAAFSPQFVVEFALNLLRLQVVQPGPAFVNNPGPGPLNGSLWSIPFEFWCYVGVLVVGLAGLARRRAWILAGFLIFTAISFVFVWKNLTPGGKVLGTIFGYPPFWARLLPYFLIGMVFYLYRASIKLTWGGAAFAMVLMLVGFKVKYGVIFVLPVTAAYLIFWFATTPGSWLKRFGKYGDFSYGIYLYSFMVSQLIVYLHGKAMSPWALFALAWPASVVCGIASWYLVERRFVVKGNKRPVAVLPGADSLGKAGAA